MELLYCSDYPSKEEIDVLMKSELLKNLFLQINKTTIESDNDFFSDMDNEIFRDLVVKLNHKIFNLKITYVFLEHFYIKNYRKDCLWYKSLEQEKKEKIIEFQSMKSNDIEKINEIMKRIEEIEEIEKKELMPETIMNEEQYSNSHWYKYYVEVFYYNIFTIFDYIVHLINKYYKMDFEPGLELMGNVMKNLENKNKDFYNYCRKIHKNPVYKKGNDLRNNITHNLSPGEMKYPINRKIVNGVKLVIDEKTIKRLKTVITDKYKIDYLEANCKGKDFSSCRYNLVKQVGFTKIEMEFIEQNLTKKKNKHLRYDFCDCSYVKPWEFKENIIQLLELLKEILEQIEQNFYK